jgi:hypothetical protein
MPENFKQFDLAISKALVLKTVENTPPRVPSFYICPYADPVPGDYNFSLTSLPKNTTQFGANIAFFTVDDDKEANTYGNGVSMKYLTHLRNFSGIQQLTQILKAAGHPIYVSYIDTPNIHWDAVNIVNFVRNTEGEFDSEREVISNDLMINFNPDGRMWDIETVDTAAPALAKVMKACFLQGVLRDPEHYTFIYTTYANRTIDQIILQSKIEQDGDEVDQVLYQLGFRQFSDLISMRGSLSRLETMSYSSSAPALFDEADTYAKLLGKGTIPTEAMRNFIYIGVAPGLTDPKTALEVAAACDPKKPDGYGGFMVWGANCPAGVAMFEAMDAVQKDPNIASGIDITKLPPKRISAHVEVCGNKNWLIALATFSSAPYCPSFFNRTTAPAARASATAETPPSARGNSTCHIL